MIDFNYIAKFLLDTIDEYGTLRVPGVEIKIGMVLLFGKLYTNSLIYLILLENTQ